VGRPPDRAPAADRPLHLTPSALLLVAAGGGAGTAARYGLSEAVPPTGSWPTATFLVNLAGAFLLGLLLEGLARGGADHGRRRSLRLVLGTGFCGAFTTYSALAVETDLLLRDHHPGTALAYALGTVVVGFAAALAGVRLAARHRPGRAGAAA
jgi:CrcB protein